LSFHAYLSKWQRGRFTWESADAEDTGQCVQDVVDPFSSDRVSTYLWDSIRAKRVQEYDQGSVDDGYVLEELAEPSTGIRFSYPKFRTKLGRYVSLRRGMWDPASATYSNDRLTLINFPVLKTHGGAGVTACIKHYMGVVSQSMIDNHPFIWNGGLAAEMAHVRFPTLNILDAIYVNPNPVEGGQAGPSTPYSRAVRANQIVAGLDPVAIDYWATKSITIPAAQSLGYSSYSSMDPDSVGGTFRSYLTESAESISAAGFQATMDPARINVREDKSATPVEPLYFAVRGMDRRVYHAAEAAGCWLGWIPLLGATADSPGVATSGTKLHVAVRGNGSRIYYGYVTIPTGVFSGWASLPGPLPQPPP